MASTKREIKTTLSLDGEKQFKDAISDSKSELKVLGSELKELTSAYKLNGDQMGYLTSKSSVLKREIAEQEKIVAQTAEMYHKAADGGEKFVGKAQRLNIQLNNSKAALNRMKAELQATDRELEEMGRDSIAAGRDIERGLTDAAQDASREIKDMVTETEGSLGKMKSLFSGGVGITATIGAVVGAGVGAFNTLSGLAEEGAEYTLTVGKLRANAEVQGADWDFIQNEMLRVTAITGDADGAVQGISAILNTGVQDAQTLTSLVDMLTGATIKYTDLDFGGVASDLQKTVSQRELVGSIADIVKGLNYDVEDVNRELQMAETDAGALNIVMGYLAEDGLEEVYLKYYEINKKVIDSQVAQKRLNDEMQTMGTNVGSSITPAIEMMGDLAEVANDVFSGKKSTEEALPTVTGILGRGFLSSEAVRNMYNTMYSFAPYSWFPHLSPAELEATANNMYRLQGGGNWIGQNNIEDLPAEFTKLPEKTQKATDETLTILEEFEQEGSEWGKRVGATLYDNVVVELWNAYNAISDRAGAINRLLENMGGGSGTSRGGVSGSTAGGGGVVINMELDGHRMGAALVPYIDSAMGKQQARTNFG